MDKPFYLMDCLLTNDQGDFDVARTVQTAIKQGRGIETIELSTDCCLHINQIYRVQA